MHGKESVQFTSPRSHQERFFQYIESIRDKRKQKEGDHLANSSVSSQFEVQLRNGGGTIPHAAAARWAPNSGVSELSGTRQPSLLAMNSSSPRDFNNLGNTLGP